MGGRHQQRSVKTKSNSIKQHNETKVLTDEQKDIIDLSKEMDNNEILAIQACAGSGKTSTLREIALANPKARFLYLAFNKAIATEAKKRFPSNVEARTIHSLAFAYAKIRLGEFVPQSKITLLDLEELVEFDFESFEPYGFSCGLNIFESFLKSDSDFSSDLSGYKTFGGLLSDFLCYLSGYKTSSPPTFER